ncbi:MAG: sigma-54 dependent transcriptional regulator [bacterium]
MKRRILVVDDEKNIRRTLAMVLGSEGFDVAEAASAEEGLALLAKESADVVVMDLNLPGLDGLAALKEIKRADPDRVVLMISGQGTVAAAVEATRAGAFDFLEKPLTKERVLLAVRNALELRTVGREWREMKANEAKRRVLLGDSAAMRKLREEIERAAPSTARILILGESGTGKELVARAIHEGSARKGGPFVKVNCAAIPEELIESELFGAVKGAYTGADSSRDGKFLQADGGTLFLDEVADMSLKAQAKVLRVLQEGEVERVGGGATIRVDVRVIAATNKEIETEVAGGRFREDLYFRLNVLPIRVPALREHRDDVALLARHFLERFRLENNRPPMRFAKAAEDALAALPWRGNVRELENAVERLAIMTAGAEIDREDLARAGVTGAAAMSGRPEMPAAAGSSAPSSAAPASSHAGGTELADVQAAGGLVEARRLFEVACIRRALEETGGNVTQAARLLAIDRTNLHKKIQAYGMEAKTSPEGGAS